jgi:ABC-type multidrug transport system fused ATPase/permease subunit
MSSQKRTKSLSTLVGTLFYVIEGSKAKYFKALFLGLLLNSFISVANPLALKYLFDEGIIRGDFRLFVILGVSFVLIFTFWRLGLYGNRLYVQKLKNTVFEKLCLRMLKKYYEIPYNEVIKKEQGYFLSRTYDEVVTTAPQTIDNTISLFNTTVTLFVALAVVLSISWRAALTILVAVPLVWAVSRKYAKKIKRESKLEKEEEAKLRGVLGRALNSYKITRTFNLQEMVFTKTTGQLHKFVDAFFIRFRTSAHYQTLSGMLMSYAETIAIIGAGYEMLNGRMTFGGYMGFMNGFWMVIGAVRSIFDLVPEMSRISGQVERLREFEDLDGRLTKVSYSDAVKLERVTFAYNGKNVLEDFNFEPGKGQKILVVGPNGSGKSTLAHLVAGLLEPTSGTATTLPLDRVSAIIYPCDFIPGTVKENLSFVGSAGQKEASERLAREFGLDGHLDKDASELSAGQRKKLEVIMGLVKDADVYVFDEPLAGVDIGSKDRLIGEIFRHTEGKTVVVIMHGDGQFHQMFDRVVDLEAYPSAVLPAREGLLPDGQTQVLSAAS